MKKNKLETLESKVLYVADQLNQLIVMHASEGAKEDDLEYYRHLVKIQLAALDQATHYQKMIDTLRMQYQFNKFLSKQLYDLDILYNILLTKYTDGQNSKIIIDNQEPIR